MTGAPPMPQNVKLHIGDTTYPIECFYVGLSEGVHVWRAVWRAVHTADAPADVRVTADELPPKTVIEIEWQQVIECEE